MAWVQLVEYALLAFALTFLLCTIGGIVASCGWKRVDSSLYLPIGLATLMANALIAFKVGRPWLLAPLTLLELSLAIVISVRRHLAKKPRTGRVIHSIMLSLLGRTKPIIAIASLAAILGSVLLGLPALRAAGFVPSPTSFDTSSGDMFSYLIVSEGLKNVGWDGLTNFQTFELAPGIGETLATHYEHMGSTGYLLLASVATVAGVPTWSVGSLVVMVSWLAVVMASIGVLTMFGGRRRPTFVALALLPLFSASFLILIGWWALNQILFTLLLLMSLAIGTAFLRESNRSRVFGLALLLGIVQLVAIETYPAVALYSLVPLTAATTIIVVWQHRTRSLSAVAVVLGVYGPLAYLLLGTGQQLIQILRLQFDHTLDLGFPAPSIFQMFGLPIGQLQSNSTYPGLLLPHVSGATALFAITTIAFTVWSFIKLPGSGFKVAQLGLLVCGSGVLLIYATTLGTNLYVTHKLILLWFPISVISVTCLLLFRLETTTADKPVSLVRQGGLLRLTQVALVVLCATNVFAAGSYFAGMVSDSTSRDLHAVTDSGLELAAAIEGLRLKVVTSDFSRGQGWIPQDRTVMPAVVSSSRAVVNSGAPLAGFPAMTGWVIADGTSKPEAMDVLVNRVNSVYSIRFVCRVVCADPSSGLSAWLLQGGAAVNEFSGLADFHMAGSGLGKGALVVIGAPEQTVRVKATYRILDSRCAPESNPKAPTPFYDVEGLYTLDKTGRGVLSTPPLPVLCPANLQGVEVR